MQCGIRLVFGCWLLLIYSINAFAITGPITGVANVTLGSNQLSTPGYFVNVPVNVDFSTMTGVDASQSVIPLVLGGYRFAIRYDNTLIQPLLINGKIPGGLTAEFSAAVNAHIINDTSNISTLVFHASQTSSLQPTGNIHVVNIPFLVKANTVGLTANISIVTMDLRTPISTITVPDTSLIGGVMIPNTVTNIQQIGILDITVLDSDSDGIADAFDNCFLVSNPTQDNLDGDAFGNSCDNDIDGDGFTLAQGDWNDYDNTLYPNAPEICGDGIDQSGSGGDLACTIPVVASVVDQTVKEGKLLVVPLSATDAGGDILTFSINTLPSFISLIDNANGTASLTIAPGYADAGSYPVTLTVNDDGVPTQSSVIMFNVVVTDAYSAHQYTALNPNLVSGSVNVVSLSDNNIITAGNTTLTLMRNQLGVIPSGELTQGTTITGTKAFDIGGSIHVTDMPAPSRFAGTQFVIPHIRFNHYYYMQSPEGDANAQIQIGANNYTVALPQGQVVEFNAGLDNAVSGTITTDLPILVSHLASKNSDSYAVPPAALEIWGIRSQQVHLGAISNNTNVTIYTDDGSSVSVVLNAGDRYMPVIGVSTYQGTGSSYRVIADQPIAAVQIADSDGSEQTAFMRTEDLAIRFGIPTDAQYIAVACPTSGTTVGLYDTTGALMDQQTCLGDNFIPGKAYFGNVNAGAHILAGAYLESSHPIHVIYEDSVTNDEHNLLGYTPNRTPVIINPNFQVNNEQDAVNLPLVVNDPDADILYFSEVGLPAGLSIDALTGVISGTINIGTVGSYIVTVMVVDRSSLKSLNINWVVN